MNRTRLAVAMGVVLSASVALAQQTPPALMVPGPDNKSEPLTVAKVRAEVRILGHLAETRMALTFANPHERALAGDLYFPLPEGATVSGYALDIGDAMVDGVVVEKERGRVVFESIVRQGIDPGLVEWTKGNNFKTRVFPIPAKGTRTVRVDYVTDLADAPGGAVYPLPLKFKDKLSELAVRVEVVASAAEPRVAQSPLPGLRFERDGNGFLAEAAGRDLPADADVVVNLPGGATQPVLVEKGPDGEFYFAITHTAERPADLPPAAAVKRVTVLWDASASRGKVNHRLELALLKSYFAELKGEVAVELVLFRHLADLPRRFTARDGQCNELLVELGKVQYDGGTQMAAIAPAPGAAPPDLYLLFTDGISNFGQERPEGLAAPVYAFASDDGANHAFLRWLAIQTGGAYFNLARVGVDAALAGIGRPEFSFLAADVDRAAAADIYPSIPVPVRGRFTLAGRLTGETAAVTLKFGLGAQPAGRPVTYVVSRDGASEGGLLRRFWAQARVGELMIFADRNEQEITATGMKYGLVTPYTSLIVLDNLEQYLQHGIEPPASLPEMRKAYWVRMDTVEMQRKETESKKLDRVLAMWAERVKWHETKFEYPKDFRYAEPVATTQPEVAGSGELLLGGQALLEAARPSAPAGADAPAPGPRPAEEPARLQAIPPPAPPAAVSPGALDVRDDSGSLFLGGQAMGGENRRGPGDGPADAGRPAAQPGVAIKPWDPKTPYLEKLKAARPDELLETYQAQRAEFGNSPAFFLDCADHFVKRDRPATALQVLSNIAELQLEDAALLRVLGHRLAQMGYLDYAVDTFEAVLKLRAEEPQSHRDLALVLARRAERTAAALAAQEPPAPAGTELREQVVADYARAVELLYHVALNEWARFEGIEVIALTELNAMLPRARALGLEKVNVDARLVRLLDTDLRIVLTWDADLTDVDLWVTEPSGEKCFYSHARTTIGGHLSTDFTQGYGPEEYMVRKAMNGTYKVQANFYGSGAQSLIGAVTLQVEVITNFGRPDEQRRGLTRRLTDVREVIDIGEIEF